jgi:hypothetical protein
MELPRDSICHGGHDEGGERAVAGVGDLPAIAVRIRCIAGVATPFAPGGTLNAPTSGTFYLVQDRVDLHIAGHVVRQRDRRDPGAESARPNLGGEGVTGPQTEEQMLAHAQHEDVIDIEESLPAEAVDIEATRDGEVPDGERDEADALLHASILPGPPPADYSDPATNGANSARTTAP